MGESVKYIFDMTELLHNQYESTLSEQQSSSAWGGAIAD